MELSFKSSKRSPDNFSHLDMGFPPPNYKSKKIRISLKKELEHRVIKNKTSPCQPHSLPKSDAEVQVRRDALPLNPVLALAGPEKTGNPQMELANNNLVVASLDLKSEGLPDIGFSGKENTISSDYISSENCLSTTSLAERMSKTSHAQPLSHRPWKNYRVICGHTGWVRSVAFDPSNSWICTGSADRTIKIWDIGSGRLKLTLTGHRGQVRGLAVSAKHTYMFSAGDDEQVNCWDLEQNKVIRSFHGHLSGIYCLALHPTLDILLTGGRDSVCRVWDIRSKMQIHALSGHTDTVCSVLARPTDPQVLTGSSDSTIKFWDIRNGKTNVNLTHHKKSIRAMVLHPKGSSFASASADSIKKFKLINREYSCDISCQQKTIINSMAVNEDGVLATGDDNGSIQFWDWRSGHSFQQSRTILHPGSLDYEASIYALSFDVTGSRLVSCGADKTIKMWKED